MPDGRKRRPRPRLEFSTGERRGRRGGDRLRGHGVPRPARAGGGRSGRPVAIWRAGGLGLSAVGVARALGAASFVAVDPRARARETGADGTPDTVELAVRSLASGGRAVAVGVGTGRATASRLMSFVMRERALPGSYGAEPEEVAEAIALLAAGRLKLPHLIGDELAAAGAETLALRPDVTADDAPEHIVATTVERFGRVDVLVNNAAVHRAVGSSAWRSRTSTPWSRPTSSHRFVCAGRRRS